MEPERASAYLGWLVTERKVSFSTQKQALNALAFFFKDVCGRDSVEFLVRLRKTPNSASLTPFCPPDFPLSY